MRITYHSIVRERESGEEIDIHRERGGGWTGSDELLGLETMEIWLAIQFFYLLPSKRRKGAETE